VSQHTFVDKCLNGDADLDDIDDFVQAWHEGDGPGLELREFLGMTREEYGLWLEHPTCLPAIVAAHRFGFPLFEAVKDLSAMPIAARALNPEEAADVLNWLKQTRRV